MIQTADVLICGAGIAGISAAYHLVVKHGIRDVLLIDERSPLSLTSDKSTECYRNWWPGPGNAMVALMNRSIDLLDELADKSGNQFNLTRRGYLYVTADPNRLNTFIQAAKEPPQLGAGSLRIHRGTANEPEYIPAEAEGYKGQPTGADLLLAPELIFKHYPYLSKDIIAALHVRRAGWFSAQQLGAYLLQKSRDMGLRYLQATIANVDITYNHVRGVTLGDGRKIATDNFVNAAGPFLKTVGRMVGIELPVYSELHLKVAFRDTLGVVPRQAPLLIWSDPQQLTWSDDERAFISEDEADLWMLSNLPSGVHTRPEGGEDSNIILMLWEYKANEIEPVFPPPLDEQYPEVVLRGLVRLIPGLKEYIGKSPRPILDGGYYTKTRENRPLIGPLPVKGAFVIGALSGFGLMASCAAGELLAAHLTSTQLPSYAPAFQLERYSDPDYQKMLANWVSSGQL
jgi:glycine/D-amino acid oxidase-like deaminating enzyme